jgi:hypothetical protein
MSKLPQSALRDGVVPGYSVADAQRAQFEAYQRTLASSKTAKKKEEKQRLLSLNAPLAEGENKDTGKGKWKKFKGSVKKLTDGIERVTAVGGASGVGSG